MARDDAAMRRLTTIPGIGTINATALAAAVGNARAFRRGRDMAAWLGLTPRQMTTGGKPRLLGISKRGNRYLRKNLIHGARAVLPLLGRAGDAARAMGARPAGAGAQEHRRRGAGQQAGAHRLGGSGARRRPMMPEAKRRRMRRLPERRSSRRRVAEVCEWWKEDGLTVERQLENLKQGTARRGRCDYEDQAARISILAGERTPRPDTLKQTDQSQTKTPLRTGRAIRSLPPLRRCG